MHVGDVHDAEAFERARQAVELHLDLGGDDLAALLHAARGDRGGAAQSDASTGAREKETSAWIDGCWWMRVELGADPSTDPRDDVHDVEADEQDDDVEEQSEPQP